MSAPKEVLWVARFAAADHLDDFVLIPSPRAPLTAGHLRALIALGESALAATPAVTVESLMSALGAAHLYVGSSMTGATGTVDERLAKAVALLNAATPAVGEVHEREEAAARFGVSLLLEHMRANLADDGKTECVCEAIAQGEALLKMAPLYVGIGTPYILNEAGAVIPVEPPTPNLTAPVWVDAETHGDLQLAIGNAARSERYDAADRLAALFRRCRVRPEVSRT